MADLTPRTLAADSRTPNTGRRGFCLGLLGLAAIAVASLALPAEVSAAIPRGDSYRVEYSRSSSSGWKSGGTYYNHSDALRAANRYKFQGYAVRMMRDPGNRYVPVPSMTVNPTRRHAPRN